MHPGEIGEHPVGVPNNLMPYIQQVKPLDAPALMLQLCGAHAAAVLRSRLTPSAHAAPYRETQLLSQ